MLIEIDTNYVLIPNLAKKVVDNNRYRTII